MPACSALCATWLSDNYITNLAGATIAALDATWPPRPDRDGGRHRHDVLHGARQQRCQPRTAGASGNPLFDSTTTIWDGPAVSYASQYGTRSSCVRYTTLLSFNDPVHTINQNTQLELAPSLTGWKSNAIRTTAPWKTVGRRAPASWADLAPAKTCS